MAAKFKGEIDSMLENTNFFQDGTGVARGTWRGDMFDMDSAHDELFETTLANVTTATFGCELPSGIIGEDRYQWWLQKKANALDDIYYFALVEPGLPNASRSIAYINDKGELDFKHDSSPSYTGTSRFFTKVFKGGEKEDKSFLFQTVHDAGKQVINTHMPTASNFIDSAGTPIRDKKPKLAGNATPRNYDSDTESDFPGADVMNKSIMSREGTSQGKEAYEKPWYQTKYSLLIYKYVILPYVFGGEEVFIGKNREENMNMAVVNFVWQLTLYFTIKSWHAPEHHDVLAIWYLSHIMFTRYEDAKQTQRAMKIKVISTNELLWHATGNKLIEIMKYFVNWFEWGERAAKTDYYEVEAMMAEDIFNVSQTKCAQFINELNIPGVIVSPRSKVVCDIETLPFYAHAKRWCEDIGGYQGRLINKRILQILKYSGDTSHIVQTILQFKALKLKREEVPHTHTRVTLLTTLERILSGRMIYYIKSANSGLQDENLGVIFETGKYLEQTDIKLMTLINKLKQQPVDPPIRYQTFGIFKTDNPEQRLTTLKNEIKLNINNINTLVGNVIIDPKDYIKSIEGVALDDEDKYNKIKKQIEMLYKLLFQYDNISESIKNVGQRVREVEINPAAILPQEICYQLLQIIINSVLYKFSLTPPCTAPPRGTPETRCGGNIDGIRGNSPLKYDNTFLSGQISNYTLNMSSPESIKTQLHEYSTRIVRYLGILDSYIKIQKDIENYVKDLENYVPPPGVLDQLQPAQVRDDWQPFRNIDWANLFNGKVNTTYHVVEGIILWTNNPAELLFNNSQFIEQRENEIVPLFGLHSIFYKKNIVGIKDPGDILKNAAKYTTYDAPQYLFTTTTKIASITIPNDYKGTSFLGTSINNNSLEYYNRRKENIDILITLIEFFLHSGRDGLFDGLGKGPKKQPKRPGFVKFEEATKKVIETLKEINTRLGNPQCAAAAPAPTATAVQLAAGRKNFKHTNTKKRALRNRKNRHKKSIKKTNKKQNRKSKKKRRKIKRTKMRKKRLIKKGGGGHTMTNPGFATYHSKGSFANVEVQPNQFISQQLYTRAPISYTGHTFTQRRDPLAQQQQAQASAQAQQQQQQQQLAQQQGQAEQARAQTQLDLQAQAQRTLAQHLQQQAQQQAQASAQAQSHGFAGAVGQGISFGNVGVIPNQFSGAHQLAPSVFAPTPAPAPAPAPATAAAAAPSTAQTQLNINISDQLYHILTIFYNSLELNEADLWTITSINRLFGTNELPKDLATWKYKRMEWIQDNSPEIIDFSIKKFDSIMTTCILDLIYIVPSLFTEKELFDEDGRMVNDTKDVFVRTFSSKESDKALTERELYFLQILENFLVFIKEGINTINTIDGIISNVSKITEVYNTTLILETKLNNDISIDNNELENNLDDFDYPQFSKNFNTVLDLPIRNTPGMISAEDWGAIHEVYIAGSGFNHVAMVGSRVHMYKGMLELEGVNSGFRNWGLGDGGTGAESGILCNNTPNPNHIRGWNYLFGMVAGQEEVSPTKFENHPIWYGITEQDTSCFFNDNYDNMMRLCINRIKKYIELQSVILKYNFINSQ